MEDLLLGFVADGTGVVEDQPGVGFVLHAGVALLLQGAYDFFGVMGVHLAAEGFDVESLAHLDSISLVARQTPGWLAETGMVRNCNFGGTPPPVLKYQSLRSRGFKSGLCSHLKSLASKCKAQCLAKPSVLHLDLF